MNRPPLSSDTSDSPDTSASGVILPEDPSAGEKRAERAIMLLYLFFFLLWSAGLLFGLYAPDALFRGLPLWFCLGAVASYPITCVALFLLVRRVYS